jgi:phospholipase C
MYRQRRDRGSPISRRRASLPGDRAPGPNFSQSQQFQLNQPYPPTYFIDSRGTAGKTPYQQAPTTPSVPQLNTAYAATAPGPLSDGSGPFANSPVPNGVPTSELPTLEPSFEKSDLGLFRTGGTGLAQFSEDTRVKNASTLLNGSFQITGPTLKYDSYTGDMVHRLFHMWQQSDCDVLNATPNNPAA